MPDPLTPERPCVSSSPEFPTAKLPLWLMPLMAGQAAGLNVFRWGQRQRPFCCGRWTNPPLDWLASLPRIIGRAREIMRFAKRLKPIVRGRTLCCEAHRTRSIKTDRRECHASR